MKINIKVIAVVYILMGVLMAFASSYVFNNALKLSKPTDYKIDHRSNVQAITDINKAILKDETLSTTQKMGAFMTAPAFVGFATVASMGLASAMMHVLLKIFSAFGFIFSVITIFCGYRLTQYKSWSRRWIIFVSFLLFFFYPIGTLWSIYCLIILFHSEIRKLFITSHEKTKSKRKSKNKPFRYSI